MNCAKRSGRGATRQFDWDDIKQRLARVQQAIAVSHRLSPEQAQVVMDLRAQALAQAPDRAADTSQTRDFVVWTVGDVRFAIETRFVREVHRTDKITQLPDSPEFLRGVTNLRGEILAVFDLHALLDVDSTNNMETAKVLILGTDRVEFGILADEVREVIALGPGQVLDPTHTIDQVEFRCLAGVTHDAMLVLDGDALLRDPRLVIDQSD